MGLAGCSLALLGCSSAPAPADPDLVAAVARLHAAAARAAADDPFTERQLFVLPDGARLRDCDLRGTVASLDLHDEPAVLAVGAGGELRTLPFPGGGWLGLGPRYRPAMASGSCPELGSWLACGGEVIAGFQRLDAVAGRDDGETFSAAGRWKGETVLLDGGRVVMGVDALPRFGVRFTADGLHAAWVRPTWLGLGNEGVIAPVSAPGQARSLGAAGGALGWPLSFSRDGSHWAGVVSSGADGAQVVVDGQAQGRYAKASVWFAGEPQVPVVWAERDGKSIYVVGGRELPAFPKAWQLQVARGGTRTAFLGCEEQRHWLVVDGEPVVSHDELDHLCMTADGSSLACTAVEDGVWMVLHDDKRLVAPRSEPPARWDRILELALSADGSHVAWLCRARGRQRLFLDDRQVSSEDRHAAGPVFSPDSASLAFAECQDERWWLCVNGERAGPFDAILQVTFAPDGRKVAFVARQGREVWRRVLVVRAPAAARPRQPGSGQASAAAGSPAPRPRRRGPSRS